MSERIRVLLDDHEVEVIADERVGGGMFDGYFLSAAWENAKRDVARITPRQRRIFDNNDALRRIYGGGRDD